MTLRKNINFLILAALLAFSGGCNNAMKKSVKSFPDIVPAIGPYSHVCEAGDFVFLSGQIAIDVKGNLITEDVKEQTRIIFKNIEKTLAKVDLKLDNVVKVTVFLTDMAKFGLVNEVYAEYFKSDYPVRSTVGVKELPKGAQVEIEVVCYK